MIQISLLIYLINNNKEIYKESVVFNLAPNHSYYFEFSWDFGTGRYAIYVDNFLVKTNMLNTYDGEDIHEPGVFANTFRFNYVSFAKMEKYDKTPSDTKLKLSKIKVSKRFDRSLYTIKDATNILGCSLPQSATFGDGHPEKTDRDKNVPTPINGIKFKKISAGPFASGGFDNGNNIYVWGDKNITCRTSNLPTKIEKPLIYIREDDQITLDEISPTDIKFCNTSAFLS